MVFLAGGAAFAVLAAICAVWPGCLARIPPQAVRASAVVGAAALVSSSAAPTGWVVLDAAARAVVGAGIVLALARLSERWALWLAAGTVTALVFGGNGPWAVAGAVGVGILGAAIVSGEAHPPVRAAASALALAPLGHLDWPVAAGASAALTAAALVPIAVAGARIAPPHLRRKLPWIISGAAAIVVVGGVTGALAALTARSDVDRAVDAAVAGLDAADADDPAPAVAKLTDAAEAFDRAETTLRAWWARPALLVPGVAQQARAVATMADSGADLARAAATSLGEVDLDTLHPVDGRIDPALVAQVEPSLTRALASLRRADRRLSGVRSPLLVAPVASRLSDLAQKVADARATAETASSALAVAPELLGADGPRRYFLVMQTPSELRGIGGFMGSWGELVIDDGRFDLTRTGRLRELTEGGAQPSARRIEGQADFVGHWGQAPAQYWGLIGFSPDFPTVGSIITQLYPESGGSELDGVISLDPAGFAALLELTGPISVAGYDGQLTAENAEQVLLHDQYLGGADDDREAFLEEATNVLFDELTGGDLPGPRSISAALAPMVQGRHIQLFSVHRAPQRFFTAIGADGSVQRRRPDGFGVVSQNFNGNKIDYFLRRSMTYDVTWDPRTGVVAGTLEVRLQNLAPASGLPHAVIGWGGDLSANQLPVADGENLDYVSLYSAAPLTDVTVDGAPAELNRVVPDLGYQAQDLYVRIPSQGTVVIRAAVRTQLRPGDTYAMEVLRQVTATPDQITVRVRVPEGWRVAGGGRSTTDASVAELQADAGAPVGLRLRAERAERPLLDRWRGR